MHNFWHKNASQNVSLIATGGLVTPGQMLKAIALGADAVYIGTAAIMALVSEQIVEATPFEPPTSLVVYTGKMTDSLDIEKGANSLNQYLTACVKEMEQVIMSLGKKSVNELDKTDLTTFNPFIAKAIGVDFGYISRKDSKNTIKICLIKSH